MTNIKGSKNLILFVLLILILLVTATQKTYSYFDSMISHHPDWVPIGEWLDMDATADANNLLTYLDMYDTLIETQPNQGDANLEEYLYELLFETVDGVPDTTQINPLFEDYTLGEMVEAIDLIREYTENFLIYEDGQPVFPERTMVTPIEFDYDRYLLPGESMQFYRIIQTANLADVLDWSPIMLSISIEAPQGEDISDFAIELLFDQNPFSAEEEFSYNWLLRDETTTNLYLTKDSVRLSQNDLTTLAGDTVFNTVVYRNENGNYATRNYRQRFLKPSYTGNWSRLPYGPNYYLAAPATKSSLIGLQQMFEMFKGNSKRTGIILAGKANGTRMEMRIDIPIRVPYDGVSAPFLPFVIALTRGLELDEFGNPLPIQSTLLVKPIIKMMVVQGQVWEE